VSSVDPSSTTSISAPTIKATKDGKIERKLSASLRAGMTTVTRSGKIMEVESDISVSPC
jgi:hypothetical protein